MAEWLTKATRGSFQYKTTTNVQSIPEIQKGVYLNLRAEYKWNNDNELLLKIFWEPYAYDSTTKKSAPYTTKLDNGFGEKAGVLTVTGQQDLTNQELNGSTGELTISNLGSIRAVEISFKYESGNAIVDLTKDYNILKIPKPSKYDNNVVFNRDGLNEMIDYFKKYPVRLTEESDSYGNIKIAHGIDTAKNVPIHGLGHQSGGLAVTTNLLPNEDAKYNLGSSTDFRWKNLYLSDNATIGGTVTAKTLDGLLKGKGIQIGGTDAEPRFKVDENGDVTMTGNIYWGDNQFTTLYHTGNLTEVDNYIQVYSYTDGATYYYHDTGNTFKQATITGTTLEDKQRSFEENIATHGALYKADKKAQHTPPTRPEDNTSVTEVINSNTGWHKVLNAEKDWYMTMTFNGGQEWTEPFRINAQDGAEGTWNARTILDALRDIDADGIYNLPSIGENGKVKGHLGIKATAIQSLLNEFGIIEMGVLNKNADGFSKTNSWALDNTQLMGGYITFPIPAPFTLTPLVDIATQKQVDIINNSGWRARLGYLRGNGDGNNPTSGVGLAIYTTATFQDIYEKEINAKGVAWQNGNVGGTIIPTATATNVANKCHLLLSFLMLTDAGLGLLTSVNKSRPSNWVFKDNLNVNAEDVNSNDGAGNDGQGNIPHYYYRWWAGNGESKLEKKDNYKRINRLWLHEDNGGLYWSGGNGTSLKPWNWADGQITG